MAPKIFNSSDITPDFVSVRTFSNGSIMLKPHNVTLYRKIQKILLDNKIEFNLKDRTVKVVIRGILIDVLNEELKSELKSLNFHL